MTLPSTNPELIPLPVRLAAPLIESFIRSGHCPPEHVIHARSTLPVLALFVAMMEEHDSRGLPWHRLDPAGLLQASLDAEDSSEIAFLRDLLGLSSAFYGFLALVGVLRRDEAHPIRCELAALALGLTRGERRPPAAT